MRYDYEHGVVTYHEPLDGNGEAAVCIYNINIVAVH